MPKEIQNIPSRGNQSFHELTRIMMIPFGKIAVLILKEAGRWFPQNMIQEKEFLK